MALVTVELLRVTRNAVSFPAFAGMSGPYQDVFSAVDTFCDPGAVRSPVTIVQPTPELSRYAQFIYRPSADCGAIPEPPLDTVLSSYRSRYPLDVLLLKRVGS